MRRFLGSTPQVGIGVPLRQLGNDLQRMIRIFFVVLSLMFVGVAFANNPMPIPDPPDCAYDGNCGGTSSGAFTWEGILYALGPILFFYLIYLYGESDRGKGIKRKPEPKQTREEKVAEKNELERTISELLEDPATFDALIEFGFHPSWNTVPNWYHQRLNSPDEEEQKKSRQYLDKYRRFQEFREKHGESHIQRIIEKERRKLEDANQ